jgi:hypothetical protein
LLLDVAGQAIGDPFALFVDVGTAVRGFDHAVRKGSFGNASGTVLGEVNLAVLDEDIIGGDTLRNLQQRRGTRARDEG